jgi:hypothetical protein
VAIVPEVREGQGDPAVVAIANILVGLVAVLHLYFLALEMFLWRGTRG